MIFSFTELASPITLPSGNQFSIDLTDVLAQDSLNGFALTMPLGVVTGQQGQALDISNFFQARNANWDDTIQIAAGDNGGLEAIWRPVTVSGRRESSTLLIVTLPP